MSISSAVVKRAEGAELPRTLHSACYYGASPLRRGYQRAVWLEASRLGLDEEYRLQLCWRDERLNWRDRQILSKGQRFMAGLDGVDFGAAEPCGPNLPLPTEVPVFSKASVDELFMAFDKLFALAVEEGTLQRAATRRDIVSMRTAPRRAFDWLFTRGAPAHAGAKLG